MFAITTSKRPGTSAALPTPTGIATPFPTAFSRAASTASGSVSTATTGDAPRRGDREDARARADVEHAPTLELQRRERLEALLGRRMQAGAECHAGIEHDLDGVVVGLGPRRSHHEGADA